MIPCILTGSLLLAVAFVCTLLGEAFRSITPAEIRLFRPHHPHVAGSLDRLRMRRGSVAIILSLIHYPSLIAGTAWCCRHLPGTAPGTYAVVLCLYTYLYILCGIAIPKALGNRFREPLAFLFAIFFDAVSWVFLPLTALPTLANRLLDSSGSSSARVVSELQTLADFAAAEKTISREQASLITRSIAISTVTAADIMVGRNEMRILSDSLTLAEALVEAHLHHHTRFPLAHGGDIDQIIGYVNFKDIVGALRVNPADPSLSGIRRPIESVHATEPLSSLLRVLTRGYQHIVIVKNDAGKTLGMATLEDLMEALVGDLEDEYDRPPSFIVQLAGNRFCAGGGATFSQLRNRLAPHFPDWDLTINEWITAQTSGVIPDQMRISYQGLTFIVRKIARGRVFDVIIERENHSPDGN